MGDKWVRHVNREHERLTDEVEGIELSHEVILSELQWILEQYAKGKYPEVKQEFRMMAYRAEFVMAEIQRVADLDLVGREYRLGAIKTEFWKVREDFERLKHDNWSAGVSRQYGEIGEKKAQVAAEERELNLRVWQSEADKIREQSPTVKYSYNRLAELICERLKLEPKRAQRIRKELALDDRKRGRKR